MPLHLLGKKSWNVYNKDNIERVQRDEAAAAAREEAEEQRMQELDALRRTAILRGEAPPPLPEETEEKSPTRERSGRHDGAGRERKRRRLRGEDDTDREIRYAREDAASGEQARAALTGHSTSDKPLHDHAGHINLFPAPDEREIRKAERNAEVEAEKAKKKKEYEDNYTVRFSDAAGYKRGLEKPWYAARTGNTSSLPTTEPSKDVWGNIDPRRKEREQTRASANDPMAFMQRAQVQLRQAEQDRSNWQKEKAQELEELKRAQEKQRRTERERSPGRRRRRRSRSVNSLEGFNLDAPARERGERDRERSRRDKRRSGSGEHRHRSSRSEHRRRSRSPKR